MVQKVQDKGAEIGINLSVVIQACILGGIFWGVEAMTTRMDKISDNIIDLTSKMASLSTVTSVNGEKIANNTKDIIDIRMKLDNYINKQTGK